MNARSSSLPTRRIALWGLRILPILTIGLFRLQAATYWIDHGAGQNAANGTSPLTAWRHCPGDPAATGIPATTILAAGDTVIFRGGVTYILAGTSGINLRWNGQSGLPITYDGNSAGTWGSGPAILSDQHGNAGLNALTGPSGSAASWIVIRGLSFVAIGGAASLPTDGGVPLPPRYGGGIAFPGGAADVTIEGCVFRQLGYAFNQRPMAATSLAGTGVTLASATRVAIERCDFSRLTTGIAFTADPVTQISVSDSTFRDAVVRTLELTPARAAGVQVWSCLETDNAQHEPAGWSGYGDSPRLSRETAAAGSALQFSASAIALPFSTYQWFKDGSALPGATSATRAFPSLSAADAGIYSVVASNPAGTGISNHLLLSVTAAPPPSGDGAPLFVTQPVSQTAPTGSSVTFSASVSGSPTPVVVWYRNGLTFSGWTGSSLTMVGVSSNDAGNYWAVATNSAGSATSATATLSVGSTPPPGATTPVFTLQPQSATATAKTTVSFTASATGTPAPTYQWRKDGAAISGATTAKLTLASVNKGSAGTYTVLAANSAGSAVSNPATLTVTNSRAAAPSDPTLADLEASADRATSPATDDLGPVASRLVNVSVLTFLPAGREGAALGFVIEGPGPRRVLLRAIGPSLADFSVPGCSENPRLAVHRDGSLVTGNDDWAGAAALREAFVQAGAFPLPDPSSLDAALVFEAAPGAYTVTCSDAAHNAGTVLLEIYELP